jgi:hypothetical protein
MWSIAAVTAMFLPAAPITTASSTSQSPLVAPTGSTTSSYGPLIAEVAFMNSTGSSGTSIPDSVAWSE